MILKETPRSGTSLQYNDCVQNFLSNRRLLFGLAALLCIVLVFGGSVLAVWLVQYTRAADYPGAVLVADHTIYKGVPHIFMRRDTSYRTTDPFPNVYNWYSSAFDLGPETRAQSSCILMAKATTWLAIERQTSVMICDTPSGRMVFVMRSVGFRLRQ